VEATAAAKTSASTAAVKVQPAAQEPSVHTLVPFASFAAFLQRAWVVPAATAAPSASVHAPVVGSTSVACAQDCVPLQWAQVSVPLQLAATAAVTSAAAAVNAQPFVWASGQLVVSAVAAVVQQPVRAGVAAAHAVSQASLSAPVTP